MTELNNFAEVNFESLGFKAGLEIHHQLDTKYKLFCHCPVGLRRDKHEAEILRHMRPTLSELGEYDGTALMEFKTKKEVIYQLYRDSVCTYEMDDTPPFPLNEQALEFALQIALLFNCQLVDEVHISRKQYLDGSIPTGFQRTAIIGVNGWIPYKDRQIRITHLTLEEDACREVSDIGHRITFKTDRLSTPLVEVITAPDMRTPEEVMEVDEILGRVLRYSGKVRRGIGSVRQDVNVSISGGTRVEIKGVPKTSYIQRLTAREALRQKALLEIKDELRERGITSQTLHSEKKDITHLFQRTNSSVFKEVIKKGERIKGIKLQGFAGILNHPTQPDITFAQEFSGRVRVIACLDSKPNILHSDDPHLYGITLEEWNLIRHEFSARHIDTVIITWGNEEDTNTALSEIKIRAIEATRGVPNETRQAFPSGITDFERILPGPDRMYPDTDSPPIAITGTRIKQLITSLPEKLWEKERHYHEIGLPKSLAKSLTISPRRPIFDKIISELSVDSKIVAITLTQTLKEMKRKGMPVENITEEEIYSLFQGFSQNKFSEETIPNLLEDLITGNEISELKSINDGELVSLIKKIIEENRQIKIRNGDKKTEYLMGRIMPQVRGRIKGEVVKRKIENSLKFIEIDRNL